MVNVIKPVNRRSVTDEVFNKMLGQINKGTWKPGSKLPSEKELCNIFNVSRVTVRSALERLKTFGIIDTCQGEGSFVLEQGMETYLNPLMSCLVLNQSKIDAIQVMEYREMVESGTAELAVDKATDADCERLKEIINEMKAFKNNPEIFSQKDFEFHLKLAEISGNILILKVLEIINRIIEDSVENMVPLVGMDNGIYYHKLILEAIIAGDRERARNAMRDHIQKNIFSLVREKK